MQVSKSELEVWRHKDKTRTRLNAWDFSHL
jgi:hypothetical protein